MASKKTITTLRDKSIDELRSRERDLRESLEFAREHSVVTTS